MPIDPDKYIVFKREEFFKLMGELALPPYSKDPNSPAEDGWEGCGTDWDCAPIAAHIERRAKEVELADAVVIRQQDVFAPPALDAYANGIQVALSLSKGHGETTEHLREVADYFHTKAAEAWHMHGKLPD